MKEFFKEIRTAGTLRINLDGNTWSAPKISLLSSIQSITDEYYENGYTLSLRQLYYQLVAKDLIPNHQKVYKKISDLRNQMAYSGLLDWDAFEDRGRLPKVAYSEKSVSSALERTKRFYKLNRQLNQPVHIEIWTEKDAISQILRSVTDTFTVPLIVNKGYTSVTALYEAYKRFIHAMAEGKKIKILYFGDHDPSGLDMIRDIRDRLTFMFSSGEKLEAYCWDDFVDSPLDNFRDYILDRFDVEPIGLNMAQIERLNLPHNPAKIKDPRAAWYIKQFGAKSWEVDAIPPDEIKIIANSSIVESINMTIYSETLAKEKQDKIKLTGLINDMT